MHNKTEEKEEQGRPQVVSRGWEIGASITCVSRELRASRTYFLRQLWILILEDDYQFHVGLLIMCHFFRAVSLDFCRESKSNYHLDLCKKCLASRATVGEGGGRGWGGEVWRASIPESVEKISNRLRFTKLVPFKRGHRHIFGLIVGGFASQFKIWDKLTQITPPPSCRSPTQACRETVRHDGTYATRSKGWRGMC